MDRSAAKVLFGIQLTLLGIFVTWTATLSALTGLRLAAILLGLATIALSLLLSYQATQEK